MQKLQDSVVDALGVAYNDDATHVLTRVTGEAPALTSLLNVTAWWPIQAFASGAAAREDRTVNAERIRFPEHRDTGDPEFEGVLVGDYFDTVEVSAAAFDRLMARLLRVLVDGALAHGDAQTQTDEWGAFVAHTQAIEARVASQAGPAAAD